MAQTQQRARSMRVPDIRTGDQVLVLSGKEAGKKGTVEHVIRNRQSFAKVVGKYGSNWRRISPLADVAVVIEGLNVAKRHTKARPKAGKGQQIRVQQGGILDVPQPILASKVMLICPHCTQPTRVKHGTAADGKSVRVCANCGETLVREVRK